MNALQFLPKTKACSRCGETKPFDEFYQSKLAVASACKACARAQSREVHKVAKEKDPDYNHAKSLMIRYRMSKSEYASILARQNGRCAICQQEPSGKRLSVDHSHSTNRVRGLLCQPCNLALGYLKDDLLRLDAAMRYLKGNS